MQEMIEKELNYHEGQMGKIKKRRLIYNALQFVFILLIGYMTINNFIQNNYILASIQLFSFIVEFCSYSNVIKNMVHLEITIQKHINYLKVRLKAQMVEIQPK